MPICSFVFDIIIVRINTSIQNLEDKGSIAVDVNFNNVPLRITSSRINVVEFRSGRSYEFEANPEDLRQELQKTPLELQVWYKGDVVGVTDMFWPASVVDQINSALGEVTHVAELELTYGGDRVGSTEIIVRLRCKCDGIDADINEEDYIHVKGSSMDQVEHPADVMFVVGKKIDDCGICPTQPIPSSQRLPSSNLDLARYRLMEGRLMKTPELVHTCRVCGCHEVKNAPNPFQKLLDSIIAGGDSSCRDSARRGEYRHEENRHTITSDSKLPFLPDDGGRSGENLLKTCSSMSTHQKVDEGSGDNSCRRCPLCNQNLARMPQWAACSQCGYKPLPHCDENKMKDKLTAEEVINDFLGSKIQLGMDMDECKEKNMLERPCRCTCKNGKICAYCRIRKLCADLFQTNVSDSDCHGKRDAPSSDLLAICESSSKDSRAFLTQIFSELKDLYALKETKPKKFDYNTKCERILQGADKMGTKSRHLLRAKSVHKHLARSLKPKSEERKSIKNIIKRTKKEKQQDSPDGCPQRPRRRRIRKERYMMYSLSYNYRKHHRSHKCCVTDDPTQKNVPRNMGWLWNNPRSMHYVDGWKPGAIRKPIKEMMRYFLKDFPADTLRVSQYSYRRKDKCEGKEEEALVQQPTLHIWKKKDEYIITLRPLKDTESLKICADPYLEMKPIRFKITTNPLMLEIRKLKRCLKKMGYSRCTCHKPVIECYCRSFLDKKRLEYQINKECRKRHIPPCTATLVLTDSSDSEEEFDFGVTPPAGVIKPKRMKKPDLVNVGTQYLDGDWNMSSGYPMPPNKFIKLYTHHCFVPALNMTYQGRQPFLCPGRAKEERKKKEGGKEKRKAKKNRSKN